MHSGGNPAGDRLARPRRPGRRGALPATALARVVEAIRGLDMREVRDAAAQDDESAPQG